MSSTGSIAIDALSRRHEGREETRRYFGNTFFVHVV